MLHDESLQKALTELKGRLTDAYPVVRLVLFGSAARGEASEESDVDVLVLTKRPLSRSERDTLTGIVFDINLSLGTNLSTLVIDEHSWEEGPISVLPIHDDVEEQGIVL
ncbi:MAG: nucleotidyltransferase domain-containing protein [Candidatus Methylomirabilales bacterium]